MSPNPHFHQRLDMAHRSGPLSPNMEPLGKTVAVLPDDPDKITPGGIILPDISNRRTVKGRVLAKGPEVSDAVQVGDVVYLNESGGVRLTLGKQVVLFYDEDDLLAKEAK